MFSGMSPVAFANIALQNIVALQHRRITNDKAANCGGLVTTGREDHGSHPPSPKENCGLDRRVSPRYPIRYWGRS